MDEQELHAGLNWWIDRFGHNEAARLFMRLLHGLQEKTKSQKQQWWKYRQRNARYDFTIQPTASGIVIIPTTAESAWAAGIIYRDHEKGEWRYVTRNSIQLFADH